MGNLIFEGYFSLLGYAGYIPGVASENCYGVTYYKATEQSANNTLARGIDQPANIKYQSSANQEFVHHIADEHKSVS